MMAQYNINPEILLSGIRSQAIELCCSEWPSLGNMVDQYLPQPLNPFFLLPIATGISLETDIKQLTHLSANILLSDLSLRIIDDCADNDNPDALYHSIGMGSAMNVATTLNTIVTREFASYREYTFMNQYTASLLQVARGQYLDMHHRADNLEAYRDIVYLKTIVPYRFAATAAAYKKGTGEQYLQACKLCGEHLGWMAQILDDIESLWFSPGLAVSPVRLHEFPVLLGKQAEHFQKETLNQLIATENYTQAELCRVLDEMDIRNRLIEMALDHRDAALESLKLLPSPDGVFLLKIWLDWLLRNGESLVYRA